MAKTKSTPVATLEPVISPEPVVNPRVADDAFFATLPEGFVPGKKADYLGDVIVQLAKFPTDAEKVIWLRHNAGKSLAYLLRMAFCPDAVWMLPMGLPEFKPFRGRRYAAPSELRQELRRMYIFLKGGNDILPELKRQKLFQDILESLDPSEVGVLIAIKDHTLTTDYGLTAELVSLAFPGLLDIPFEPRFLRQ